MFSIFSFLWLKLNLLSKNKNSVKIYLDLINNREILFNFFLIILQSVKIVIYHYYYFKIFSVFTRRMYVWNFFCTFLINYHVLGCLEYDLAIFGPIFACLLWMPEKRHHERMSTRNALVKEGSHCLCSNKSDSTPECAMSSLYANYCLWIYFYNSILQHIYGNIVQFSEKNKKKEGKENKYSLLALLQIII